MIRLSAEAHQILDDYFRRMYDIDVDDINIVFGGTFGQAAFTVGYNVTLNWDEWNRYSSLPEQQVALLAHEFTHTAQYVAYERDEFLLHRNTADSDQALFGGVTPHSIADSAT